MQLVCNSLTSFTFRLRPNEKCADRDGTAFQRPYENRAVGAATHGLTPLQSRLGNQTGIAAVVSLDDDLVVGRLFAKEPLPTAHFLRRLVVGLQIAPHGGQREHHQQSYLSAIRQ